MKVQTINESSIAVFLDVNELNSRGIQPENLNSSATISLAKQAFSDLGVTVDGMIDVDAYINGQGVMVFASLRGPGCDVFEIYRFNDLEDLIGGAHALAEQAPATLLYFDSAYYLAFHNCRQKINLDALSEYGRTEERPELRYLYLSERGQVLCHGDALQVVCEHFHPDHSTFPFSADSVRASASDVNDASETENKL